MTKNILVISTSIRKDSNSDRLAAEFARGARDAGNNVEEISLKDKSIAFCRGCLACQKTLRCVMRDDADIIAQKMLKADSVAFATPIYYYEMCGQMKTLLDRMNPLFSADYAFRDIYMLSCAADDNPQTPERAVSGLTGWIDCFEKASLAGTVFAGGVTDTGEITGHQALLSAYEMGHSITD